MLKTIITFFKKLFGHKSEAERLAEEERKAKIEELRRQADHLRNTFPSDISNPLK